MSCGSLNYPEIKKAGAVAMGEDAGIERTVSPGHVGVADLAPIAAILAGVTGESRALPLKLEPARLVGISIQDRPFIDAAITIGIHSSEKPVAGEAPITK